MKCVKKISDGSIARISNEMAKKKVATGKFMYVAKHEWKSIRKPVAGIVDKTITVTTEH